MGNRSFELAGSWSPTDNYTAPNGAGIGSNNFTVMAMYRLRGEIGAAFEPVFGAGDTANNGWFIGNSIDTSPGRPNIIFAVRDSTAWQTVSVTLPLGGVGMNKLFCLVGTYEAGVGTKLYCNGQLVAQDLTAGVTMTVAPTGLEVGYLAGAAAFASANTIIGAAYRDGTPLSDAAIAVLSYQSMAQGDILDLTDIDGMGAEWEYHYSAIRSMRSVQGVYYGDSSTSALQNAPATWPNLGSAGTAGNLTAQGALQLGSFSGDLNWY